MIFTPRYIIEDDDLDLLRRFSGYIREVIRYARLEYGSKQKHEKYESYLEDLPPEMFRYEDPQPKFDDFNFEQDKLSEAFTKLNLLRKRILTLTYVEDLSAQETADMLKVPVEYVYLQKHRVLKALRDQLMDDGPSDGKDMPISNNRKGNRGEKRGK